ncbi:hypothetical protein KAH55_03660, partial [bacterium]|nr:hypothetical protein [bacterium]
MSYMRKKKNSLIVLMLLVLSCAVVHAQNTDSVRVLLNGYIQPVTPVAIDTSSETNEIEGMKHLHSFQQHYLQFSKLQKANRDTLRQGNLLQQMRRELQTAEKELPTDERVPRYLNSVYMLSERHFSAREEWDTYLNLVNEHYYRNVPCQQYMQLRQMAAAYAALEEYELAVSAYSFTIDRLETCWSDSLQARRPSFVNFFYSTQLGRARAAEKLMQIALTVQSLNAAMPFAPIKQRPQIELWLQRYTQWDNGNVVAFEHYLHAVTLYDDQHYPAAVDLLSEIFPTLWTNEARIEVQLRVAQANYLSGDRARGLTEMAALLNSLPDMSPAVTDSLEGLCRQIHAQYVYLQAQREYAAGHDHEAFSYFLLASEVENRFQRMANYMLAV